MGLFCIVYGSFDKAVFLYVSGSLKVHLYESLLAGLFYRCIGLLHRSFFTVLKKRGLVFFS